jgi:transmembrane sensor
MAVEPTRLQYLLQQYANNECTRGELLQLFEAMEEAEHDETLNNWLQEIWKNISASDAIPAIDKEKIFNNIITPSSLPALPKRKWIALKAVAAAVVIGVAAWLIYAWLHTDKKTVEKTVVAENTFKNDVPPGGNRAILTLSDGSTIILDSAQNGALTTQGNTNVNKLRNGQLEYQSVPQGGSNRQSSIGFNTLQTPRGGQYQIILPDGTKVWLNAASSLKYPTAFTGTERVVELTGEAYFEVAPQAPKRGLHKVPFIVSILPSTRERGGGRVEVLGTHFNINAYGDEESVKTTVLEGKVRVGNRQWGIGNMQHAILLPGQQAVLDNNIPKVINNINTDEVVAWKNGLFDFRSAEIHMVMRQLSRWYDIEVKYNSVVQDRFYAKIPRNTKLSDVLQALTMTGRVHFQVEGKTVTVF